MSKVPSVTLEVITPRKAAEFLKYNTRNRNVRINWVKKLAAMIRDGQFELTHNGVAINCDGTLIDGQHRLMAIIEADKPVRMFVTRGLPVTSMYGIDQGKTRDAADVGATFGYDITTAHVATANSMFYGMMDMGRRFTIGKNRTHRQTLEFCRIHAEPIDWAITRIGKPVKCSTFRAVVARAWYGADRTRLDEFCQQLVNGVNNESSVARLRTHYFADPINRSGSGDHKRALYARTEWALAAFLARKHVQRLNEAETELFPLPGEEWA